MKRNLRTFTCGSLAVVALVAACGGRETIASKSAAAFREAQTKGRPIAGDGHAHHGKAGEASSAPESHATIDHGSMTNAPAPDHATHAAMSPDHTGHGTTAMDHATMARGSTTQPDHARHIATAPTGQAPIAADAHAGHTMPASPAGASPATVAPPASNGEIARTEPAATLRVDAFDAPVPIAVAEAQKAASGGGHEGHSVLYTCPMHPEVISTSPGKCPKCGMTLVKKVER